MKASQASPLKTFLNQMHAEAQALHQKVLTPDSWLYRIVWNLAGCLLIATTRKPLMDEVDKRHIMPALMAVNKLVIELNRATVTCAELAAEIERLKQQLARARE